MNDKSLVELVNELTKTTTQTMDESASMISSLVEQGYSLKEIKNMIDLGSVANCKYEK